jgi:site-specific DNA recombinase
MMIRCPFPAGTPVTAYLRFSPGDSQSIDSQSAAVRAWCEANGLLLLRVFQDEGKSGGSTLGREDFMRMIGWLTDAGERPAVKAVVLWSFSRFAREYDDAQFFTSMLRRNGYVVHSMTDDIPEGDSAPIIEAITFWKDAQRRSEISRDAKRGLRWLAEQGYSVGGFPPRGYKKSAPVEVGRRKNGEARLAHKWEFDPKWEERVRLAWQMKLAGKLNWEIHRKTRLFKGINCYSSFFLNETYAGVRKCGAFRREDSHPAYVTAVEFARVQAQRQPARVPHTLTGSPEHPRRRDRDNPFLLSGLLFCGYCGYAVVGNHNQAARFYRCGQRERGGHEVCTQRSIVAHAIHRAVAEWAKQVLTYDHLLAMRDMLNQTLSGSNQELKLRRAMLLGEREIAIKGVGNLVGALERMGWTSEVDARLSELRREQLKLEGELAEVEDLLRAQNLELSDEVLRYLADHFAEVLLSGSPEEVRKVFRGVIARAELYRDKIVVAFAPPLFQGSGVRRQVGQKKPALNLLPFAVMSKAGTLSGQKLAMEGAPMEIRTPVLALKGPRPGPLDDGG